MCMPPLPLPLDKCSLYCTWQIHIYESHVLLLKLGNCIHWSIFQNYYTLCKQRKKEAFIAISYFTILSINPLHIISHHSFYLINLSFKHSEPRICTFPVQNREICTVNNDVCMHEVSNSGGGGNYRTGIREG